MATSRFVTSLWLVPLAAASVVAVTVVQGRLTERWAPISKDEVIRVSKLLEDHFPKTFADWEIEQEIEGDPRELERAGAVGHVSRLYRNGRSKSKVSTFVVAALPHDASDHTPDRCYPGAGFTIGESEHRVTVPLADGRNAEAFTGTFGKKGQTLRLFWTYGVPSAKQDVRLDWIAPQLATFALKPYPAVYKLYAIVDETRLGASQSIAEGEQFIADLLPALDAALTAGESSQPTDETPAAASTAAAN